MCCGSLLRSSATPADLPDVHLHFLSPHTEQADLKKTNVLDFNEYFTAQEVLMSFSQYVSIMGAKEIGQRGDYVAMKQAWDAIANDPEMVDNRKQRIDSAATALETRKLANGGAKVMPAPALHPTM